MKRTTLCTLISCFCLVPIARAQVTGSGTPNTIPQFTGSTSIGDSPLLQFNGNIGINSPNPNAKLEVKDFRNFDANGQGPNAIFGVVTCQGTPNIACAGVRGDANAVSLGAIGVIGNNFASDAQGGGGVLGQTFGSGSFTYGTRGEAYATSGAGVGVVGITWSPQGDGARFVGVRGTSGTIIRGDVGPPGAGTEFTVFRVDGDGRVFANGGFRPFGADFAEAMAVSGDRARYAPGDLLVIDASGERRLALSQTPYSTLVAGIYSTKPGVVASQHDVNEPARTEEVPLAVVGIVPCKVTAENGSIVAGDLLVTSSIPGHAMKGTDRARMLGAVVGKALEPLRESTGTIQVLVTLQ
jgi:hypothetical protein